MLNMNNVNNNISLLYKVLSDALHQEVFTQILSSLLPVFVVFCSIVVIISKNPIISVIYLIGLFVGIATYLITLGFSFFGLSYIVIYVGAVSILFLFILMLIDIRKSHLLNENYSNNSILLSVLIAICIQIILYFFVSSCSLTLTASEGSSLYNFVLFLMDNLGDTWDKDSSVASVADVSSVTWDLIVGADINHITNIGTVMYSLFNILLFNISLILVLTLTGTIIIVSNSKHRGIKYLILNRARNFNHNYTLKSQYTSTSLGVNFKNHYPGFETSSLFFTAFRCDSTTPTFVQKRIFITTASRKSSIETMLIPVVEFQNISMGELLGQYAAGAEIPGAVRSSNFSGPGHILGRSLDISESGVNTNTLSSGVGRRVADLGRSMSDYLSEVSSYIGRTGSFGVSLVDFNHRSIIMVTLWSTLAGLGGAYVYITEIVTVESIMETGRTVNDWISGYNNQERQNLPPMAGGMMNEGAYSRAIRSMCTLVQSGVILISTHLPLLDYLFSCLFTQIPNLFFKLWAILHDSVLPSPVIFSLPEFPWEWIGNVLVPRADFAFLSEAFEINDTVVRLEREVADLLGLATEIADTDSAMWINRIRGEVLNTHEQLIRALTGVDAIVNSLAEIADPMDYARRYIDNRWYASFIPTNLRQYITSRILGGVQAIFANQIKLTSIMRELENLMAERDAETHFYRLGRFWYEV